MTHLTPNQYFRSRFLERAAILEAAEAKCRDKHRERRRGVLAAPAAQKPPASSLWLWLILLFVVCEDAGDKLAATVGTKPKAKALTPEL